MFIGIWQNMRVLKQSWRTRLFVVVVVFFLKKLLIFSTVSF